MLHIPVVKWGVPYPQQLKDTCAFSKLVEMTDQIKKHPKLGKVKLIQRC